MGIAIPQVITNRSGAQVIDGSLKFDQGKTQHLTRTPSSDGNKRTWTWSGWVKPAADALGDASGSALFAAYSAANDRDVLRFGGSSTDSVDFQHRRGGSNYGGYTNAKLRDYGGSGWYHVVLVWNDAATIYVNGVEQSLSGVSNDANDGQINNNVIHYIGARSSSGSAERGWDGQMSQIYFVDGQALDASYFGFTDPLTNTWKPKKLSKLSGPNDGRIWSDTATISSGSNAANKPLSNGFDGTTATAFEGDTSGATVTVPVSATISAGGVRVFAAVTSSNPLVVAIKNGASTVETINTGSSGGKYYASSSYSGAITSLVISRTGRAPEFNAIEINGTMLIDGDRTNFGSNGFYLPFDGNSPIGEDKSGRGNDWTPVNFGGSMELDNPNVSGARPILNTTQGGAQAGVGVFGSNQNVGYAVTVYNDGGGNKYYIDGVKQATLTGLIRGATYTFDTSDSSVSSHPFRFAASDGGSEYPHGVAAITGTATTITIPHNAPNELYYYCTSHSGMGSSITGITTNASLADPFAWKNNLALPYVGSGDDVTASIGATNTSLMTSWSQNSSSFQDGGGFYNSALFMNSTSDYPRINFSAGAMNFMHNSTGTGTIEFWANSSSVTTGAVWASTSGGSDEVGFGIYSFTSGTEIGFFISKGVSGQSSSSATGKTPNGKWVHIAAVKTPTELRLYTDGILRSKVDISSYSFSSSNSARDYIQHGSPPQQSGSRGWTGAYMQDFRVYEGLEKYTGTTVGTQYFVPASTSPDILPDTPSGVSGSSKLTKITDGAVTFDGTGDYLNTAWSSDFAFGTGDFTIEMFVYWQGDTSTSTVLAWGEDIDNRFDIGCQTANQIRVFARTGGSTFVNMDVANGISTNKWIHLAVVRNSSAQTMKLYIDGVEKASTSSVTATMPTNTSNGIDIGRRRYASSTSDDYQGFISNLRIIKGTALYTSRFTPPTDPLTNVTNTKLLCCQSNTSATEAAVTPGSITANGDAAATNFTPFNTDINTVRGQETGYMTINPLSQPGSTVTLSNGNLDMAGGGTNVARVGDITVPSSGKWFWEITCKSGGSGVWLLGLGGSATAQSERLLYVSDQRKYTQSGGGFSTYGETYTTGDVIGVAVDMDADTLVFYKNGRSLGTAFSSISSTFTDNIFPYFQVEYSGRSLSLNSGQKPFKFPPPDGFQPLNTANVRPETVISRPDQYVGVTTYVGTGNGTTYTDTSLKFKPDMTWFKRRDGTVNHVLYDSVRGYGNASNAIRPNTNGSESAFGDAVVTAKDNGFSVTGSNTTGINGSGEDIVCWAWKAGGSSNTFNVDDVGYASAAAAGITDGTVALTGASVGTKQGFSILKFSPTTSAFSVAHGLNQTPTFFIHKDLDNSYTWSIYSAELGADKYLKFTTDDEVSSSGNFGSGPTASLLNFSSGYANNNDAIVFCWHDVPGLQKFGSYTGNESTDGPYVELGFRPAVLIIKNAVGDHANGANWFIFDGTRDPDNPVRLNLNPNDNSVEEDDTNGTLDFLSNGFKMRSSGTHPNGSGNTIIYAAWAEVPSVDLFGGGANAR
jgi:hypothetical protein